MNGSRKEYLLSVVLIYILDRALSLPGIPLIGVGIWGRYPETFESLGNISYIQFYAKILLILYIAKNLIKKGGDSWSAVYLKRPKTRDLVIGFGFFIILLYSDNLTANFIQSLGFNRYLETQESIGGLGPWLYGNPLKSIILISFPTGIYEETLYAFFMYRLSNVFGRNRIGVLFNILLVSTMFGLSHLYQGSYEFFEALIHRSLYISLLLWRQDLTAPIMAHITYDSNILLGNPVNELLPLIP